MDILRLDLREIHLAELTENQFIGIAESHSNGAEAIDFRQKNITPFVDDNRDGQKSAFEFVAESGNRPNDINLDGRVGQDEDTDDE